MKNASFVNKRVCTYLSPDTWTNKTIVCLYVICRYPPSWCSVHTVMSTVCCLASQYDTSFIRKKIQMTFPGLSYMRIVTMSQLFFQILMDKFQTFINLSLDRWCSYKIVLKKVTLVAIALGRAKNAQARFPDFRGLIPMLKPSWGVITSIYRGVHDTKIWPHLTLPTLLLIEDPSSTPIFVRIIYAKFFSYNPLFSAINGEIFIFMTVKRLKLVIIIKSSIKSQW